MRLSWTSIRHLKISCASVACAALVGTGAKAESYNATWIGPGANWTTGTHWHITLAGPTFPNNTGVDTFDVTMASGANTFDLNLEIDSLNFSATSLTSEGAQNLIINNTLTWSAGRFQGAGETTLQTGSVSTISTASPPNFPALGDGRKLVNAGTLTMSNNSNLDLRGGASVYNTGTWNVGATVLVNDVEQFPSASNLTQIVNDGMFNLQADGSSISARGSFDPLVFGVINNGTLVKSGGTGQSSVDAFVLNTGIVQANSGTLRILSYTQTSGRTDVNDKLSVGFFGVQGGLVTGAGTMLDSFANTEDEGLSTVVFEDGAGVSPGSNQGNAVGTLTSAAGAVFEPGSRFVWQLSDATGVAGTGWDLFDVTNTVQGIALNTTNSTGQQLTIEVSPLSLVNFNPFASYAWVVAQTPTGTGDAGLNGFTGSNVVIDLSGWANAPAGTFGVNATNGELIVTYSATIPEPVGMGVLIGACGLLLRRRAVRPTLVGPTGDVNADPCDRVA